MASPRIPRIQTNLDEPPRTPVMPQNERWRSPTPASPPEFSSAPGSPASPGSPESPISPISPITLHSNQFSSLDDQVTITKSGSPKAALQSRILSRQASLKRQPRQIGNLVIGRQVGSGAFSKTFEGHGPQGVLAVKTRLSSTSSELFVHEQRVLAKLLAAGSANGATGIIEFYPELSSVEHSVFKLYEANLETVVQSPRFRLNESHIDLFDYRSLSQPIVGSDRWARWSLELAQGLQFIHSQGVIHADLKPDNVLVSQDSVVISDFSGSIDTEEDAQSMLEKDLSSGIAWSATYTDPELLYESKPPSFGSDIYALGLIFAFIATGQEPYGMATNTVQRLTWMRKVEPLDSFEADVLPRLTRVRPVLDKCLARSLDGVQSTIAEIASQESGAGN